MSEQGPRCAVCGRWPSWALLELEATIPTELGDERLAVPACVGCTLEAMGDGRSSRFYVLGSGRTWVAGPRSGEVV
jgi:hypothetical protein